MSDYRVLGLYMFTSLALLIPALRTRVSWSGPNYTGTRARSAIIYNSCAIYFQWHLFQSGPLVGTEFKLDSDWQLSSLFFAIVHGFSLPSLSERKPWLPTKNSTKNLILNAYPDRSVTRADLLFRALFFLLILLFCAALYAALITSGILYVINKFMLVDKSLFFNLWWVMFFICIPIGAFIFRSYRNKRREKL
jgi:hypothetical protein